MQSTEAGGRFALERVIGSGGMGRVYEALDRQTGGRVAVKVLIDPGGNDMAARFERECRALLNLHHPALVRYIDHGVLASGECFLAMEWLEGEDLSARLRRGRLGARESVEFAILIAEALGAAHANGIVHRDIKPSNLFLVDGPIEGTKNIKILDFGIAHLDGGTRVTRTGTILGTIGYMAPEQARGEAMIDARADVFALGCVLFECLTGERAFAGTHAMAVLTKVLFHEPPRLREQCPELSAEFETLLARMLSKDREARPRDGREAAEALRAVGAIPIAVERVAFAETISADRPSHVLTGGELRNAAIILVGPPASGGCGGHATGNVETTESALDEALRLEAKLHGGHFERLVNGVSIIVMVEAPVASDLAAKAARCALALRKHAPGLRIVLAMGRGEHAGRLSTAHAAERAARLMDAVEISDPPRPVAIAPVRLDETTAGLLDARFDVRETELGYQLFGEQQLGEGARTLLGKATPCVGRDVELRMVAQLIENCVAEHAAAAVLVTAPPGAGKSRFAQEIFRYVQKRDEPMEVWVGRGDPMRMGSAFGLLSQVLRTACDMRSGEPLAARQEKLRARVVELFGGAETQRVAEFLGEMIGAPFPDDGRIALRAARGDPQLMNDQMLRAFLDFVAAMCRMRPVAVFLEDLHWSDRPTVRFIDRALRDLHQAPFFVLALARPEVHTSFPGLWRERDFQEINLKKLSPKASERLVRLALGENASKEVADRLVRLADGNAFYLEELIRAAAQGKGSDFPESVVAMVESRLGTLDGESRRMLRAASVFGDVSWAGGVMALVGGSSVTEKRLVELVEQEFLVKREGSRFPGEEEVAFRHALLREGAYAMLTNEDKTLGHRLAGEWLERHGEVDAMVLGEHFEKGGESERASRHFLRAADQLHWAGDSGTAVEHARRALKNPIPNDLRVTLLGMISQVAHFNPSLISVIAPHANELMCIAAQGSKQWVQGISAMVIATLQEGAPDHFFEIVAALKEIAPSSDNAAPLSFALTACAYLLDHFFGQIQEGNAMMNQFTAFVHEFRQREPRIWAYWHTVMSARLPFAEEDPFRALQYTQTEGLDEVCGALGAQRLHSIIHMCRGLSFWLLGASADAKAAFHAITLPDEELAGCSSVRPFCLAWILADRGARDEAGVFARTLADLGRMHQLPIDQARGLWALAEVQRRAGAFDAAEEAISGALAITEKLCPLDHPGVLATLAALRLAQGRQAEALAAAEEGIAKYDAMGACSYFARGTFLRLVHAECLDASGDREAARAAIAKARECMLTNARKIRNTDLQRSFIENVPENKRTLELARQWLGENP